MKFINDRGDVSRTRKVGGALVILAAVVVIASTFYNNLFSVGPAFEAMIDDFRPMIAEESTEAAQADLQMLAAVGTEFETAIVPGLSQQLGMTPEEFTQFTAANYPDVAAGVQALPEIVPTFEGLVGTLDSQRPLFESADAIPTESLPATTVPWSMLATGLGLLVGGLLLFFRPGWLGIAVTGVLSVVVVISVVALSLIPKANDADKLNENLTPIYTPELVAQANGALATVSAMGAQMQTEMLPDLAAQLGLGEAELNGFFAQNFPATAEAMATMPATMARFEGLVSNFESNLDNYETVQPVSFTPIIWTLFGVGIVGLAGTGLAFAGRRETVVAKDRKVSLGMAH